jgi:hypothetical protein
VTSTTFARNHIAANGLHGPTVMLNEGGTTLLHNCTVSGNASITFQGARPAVRNTSGLVTLENTILALNSDHGVPGGTCTGVLTSVGGNIIGDQTGCTIALQPDDLTSDPQIAELVDDGTPGNAHWPLLPESPAINHGHTAGCPATDQLGHARIGPCDIGAVEFQPAPQRVAKAKKAKR